MNSVPVNISQNDIQTPQSKTEILSALVGVALGIIVFSLIFALLNYFSIINIPFLSFLPNGLNNLAAKNQSIPTSSDDLINNCIIDKAKNPLVLEFNNVNNMFTGTFRGTIKNIQFDSSKQPIRLLLTSPNQKQTLWFNISGVRNNIYSTSVLRPIPQTSLGIGNQADINFICDKNSVLKLTQIGIKTK